MEYRIVNATGPNGYLLTRENREQQVAGTSSQRIGCKKTNEMDMQWLRRLEMGHSLARRREYPGMVCGTTQRKGPELTTATSDRWGPLKHVQVYI